MSPKLEVMSCLRFTAAVCFVTCLVGMGQVAAQDDVPTLLSRFQSEEDRARKEAILLTITTEHPDVGSALLKIATTTDDSDTRWLAIQGIGSLKFKEAAPFLKRSLSSDSNNVRANAARALGQIHDVSATPELIRMLKVEKDSGVIEQTALALQVLGAHEAVPLLKSLASNPSHQTRLWVLGAIAALDSNPKKEVRFFATFLFDENQSVAWQAAGTLQRLTGEDFGLPKCGPGLCGGPGDGIKNAQAWWNHNKQKW